MWFVGCYTMRTCIQCISILEQDSRENHRSVMRFVGTFDEEKFASAQLNTSTKLSWLLLFCNVICIWCSMMTDLRQLISILQPDSGNTDWCVMWFLGVVKRWSIISNAPTYFNRPMLRLIVLWRDFSRMFNDVTLSATHIDTLPELWCDWLTCYVICGGCSLMKYNVEVISTLQQTSGDIDWLVM